MLGGADFLRLLTSVLAGIATKLEEKGVMTRGEFADALEPNGAEPENVATVQKVLARAIRGPQRPSLSVVEGDRED